LGQGNRLAKKSAKPTNSAPADAPLGDVSVTLGFGKLAINADKRQRKNVS